ncbi:TldD/PmbA family protein [Cyanobium sp. Cruz CV13-4-11]|jgi:PmbA protein|uniref:TldD/PmbA family protein n=1 Tax=unclassified Cyanobium TaxID=2627006 RepID=UPI0020CEB76F|nr:MULTISPECIES: TldD/PmbA family protein [unclassified Cyanobium]MCP9900319.1 TldD/PmbA family protein [Cyanobium sp. Cruz CV11-17]MCP9919403.1 TldD/PmbA family protein [Cyanobium sp. Cruz CV13-4-11]
MESTESLTASLDAEVLRQRLASLAQAEGVRRWDLGASCSSDTSVQVDRGEAKQMKGAQRSAITLRVWNDDGLVGITSTSDLSDAGLARALAGARDASAYGNVDEIPDFSPLATAPLPELEQPLSTPLSILTLLDTLRDAERDLLGRHPAIGTVPYNGLAQRSSDRLYINSDGACRQQRLSTASLYLYARAEEAGRKPRSSGAVRLAYGAADLDVAGCVQEAAERTIAHLDYAPIATGRYTCVFSPEAFLDLIGAFSSLFNARAVLDGVSLSRRESLGEQLAVPFLSLHDNGLHPANVGAAAFDGEGTPTCRLSLLEGGVLRHFLHSEATARAFGVSPTGHAGLGAKVSVGPDWFEIGPTPGSGGGAPGLDRFAAGASGDDRGLVVIDSLSALHAGVKASQGSFSLPFDGWLVQDGVPRSIEAATVAGDIRTLLKAILGFEGPAKVTPDGLCPHVWVEGLSITGDA